MPLKPLLLPPPAQAVAQGQEKEGRLAGDDIAIPHFSKMTTARAWSFSSVRERCMCGDVGGGAEVGGAAADKNFGFAQGVGDYLHLPPADAVLAEADAQGLGEGLLGGEAQGEGGVRGHGL